MSIRPKLLIALTLALGLSASSRRRGWVALHHRIAGGVLRTWWRVRRPRTLGVRGIVLDADGRIALLRHTYIAGWYLPGGGVDKGESFEAALLREVREEVALEHVAVEALLGLYHNRGEGKDDHVAVFVARAFDAGQLARADVVEVAEVGWFAPDALPDGCSPATLRRIDEYRRGVSGRGDW